MEDRKTIRHCNVQKCDKCLKLIGEDWTAGLVRPGCEGGVLASTIEVWGGWAAEKETDMFNKIQDQQILEALKHSNKQSLQDPVPANIPEHMTSLSSNDVLYKLNDDNHKTIRFVPASSTYLHNINEEVTNLDFSRSLQDNTLTLSPPPITIANETDHQHKALLGAEL